MIYRKHKMIHDDETNTQQQGKVSLYPSRQSVLKGKARAN